MTLSEHDKEILAHYGYEEPIQSPNRLVHIADLPVPAPTPLYVLEIAPRKEADDEEEYDWLYFTIGASRAPMPAQADYRIELMIQAHDKHEELIDLVTSLAAYPFLQRTFLGAGHLIPGTHGVVPGSPLTDILFLPPLFQEEEFAVVPHADGSHTHILWVIPIHRAERLFCKEHGHQALIDRFEEVEVDTSDLWRPSVV